jgi:phosphatidylserine decarboxylase
VSNILNGLSQMADVPSAIPMSHALRNYSKVSRERDPTNLSLLFIATSNTHQTESTRSCRINQIRAASGELYCSRFSSALKRSAPGWWSE